MIDEFDTKIPTIKKPKIDHLNRQIPPEAHTPMYNWHKFWSRKTWNVVAEFIKTYCPSDGIVFDPFAGSGVVALEALKQGKRVIVSDILPISTELIRLTIKPVSSIKLHQAYERVAEKTKEKILDLYKTKCRKCGHEFPLTCAIWTQKRNGEDRPIQRKCVDVRYEGCPKCADRREQNTPPNTYDRKILQKVKKNKIDEWYPSHKLYHINGQPFMKKEKYESIDELFTKRNLQALAWLMEAIEEEKNKDLRDFLKIAFTSVVHLCTNMCPVRPTRPLSSAWTQQSYWFAPMFMESNVWLKFESAVVGKQGLLAGKKETNKYFENIRFAKSFKDVVDDKADVFIYNGPCFDLMKKMYQQYGDKGCVDYIFTDPPYDASIQYGELAYLWVSWLKKDEGYLEKIVNDEVVRNEKQDKNFNQYHKYLSRSFGDMFSILKPDDYLTVTFHNPTFKVRNATIYAGIFAGFELQKVHHQELARPSAKSLLQPFGSAQGDFYLRFYKPDLGEKAIKPQTIGEARFEKIVVETAKRVIAERGEPTPYTIIINTIDPELAKNGYYSELETGLDINTVLQNHLNKEFILVPAQIGGAGGKLWWFKDPSMIAHLKQVPLSERVEQSVLRKLQKSVKVTFTEVWDAVSTDFPNSLTSDSMSIKDALEFYARQASGPKGYWIIKSNLSEKEIERDHTTIIAILAEIGKAQGYKIWIGKIEQSHEITGFPNRKGGLRQYVTMKNPNSLKNIKNPDVEGIDLLWVKNNKIERVFEVESTTSMTSGLQRGSNVKASVPKFLVIPEDRERQLLTKLKTPLFSQRFKSDNWKIIYFDALKEDFTKLKGKTDLKKLIDKKSEKHNTKKKNNENQLGLFSK
ncbi:MAG: DNA adenine methylase [Parcubacteria group bacterium]|nr:DNA adenine methylase [Parcubacteria group bacterium]